MTEFSGEYFFLSNDYLADFLWRGKEFSSASHAWSHAQKTYDTTDLEFWRSHGTQVMREIVHSKFQSVPGLAGQLINTGGMMLVNGNCDDLFWGRKAGKGVNTLGVLLMEERGYWLKTDFSA